MTDQTWASEVSTD